MLSLFSLIFRIYMSHIWDTYFELVTTIIFIALICTCYDDHIVGSTYYCWSSEAARILTVTVHTTGVTVDFYLFPKSFFLLSF